MYRWYWIDNGFACGGVKVKWPEDIIVNGAPIFKRLIGKKLINLPLKYRFKRISDETN